MMVVDHGSPHQNTPDPMILLFCETNVIDLQYNKEAAIYLYL